MKVALISFIVLGWIGIFAAGTFFAVKAVGSVVSVKPEVKSIQSKNIEPTPSATKSVTPVRKVGSHVPTPQTNSVNCQIGDNWYILPSSEECTTEQNKYSQTMAKYYESVKQGYTQQPQIAVPTIQPYAVGVYPTSKPLPSLPTTKPIDGTIVITGNTPAPTVPVGYGAY